MVFFDKIKEISTAKGKGKKSKKGYLVCNDCGGYYELKSEESPQDFVACECGGKLKHTKKLETIPDNPEESDDKSNIADTNPEEDTDNADTVKADTEDNLDITDTVEVTETEVNADIDDEKAKDSKVFKSKILKSIEIETSLTCPFCGTENPDHSKFCQDCGKKIAS